jgi:hypothetical protein
VFSALSTPRVALERIKERRPQRPQGHMAAPARPSAAIQIVRPPTAQTVSSPKAPGQAQPSLTTNVDKDKRKGGSGQR